MIEEFKVFQEVLMEVLMAKLMKISSVWIKYIYKRKDIPIIQLVDPLFKVLLVL